DGRYPARFTSPCRCGTCGSLPCGRASHKAQRLKELHSDASVDLKEHSDARGSPVPGLPRALLSSTASVLLRLAGAWRLLFIGPLLSPCRPHLEFAFRFLLSAILIVRTLEPCDGFLVDFVRRSETDLKRRRLVDLGGPQS